MNGLKKNLLKAALLAVTVCALPALAGPDSYGLGNGTTPLTVTTANTAINSYAQVTAPLAPGDTTIQVGPAVVPPTPPNNTKAFAVGDLVLVLQMTGIVPEPPSGGPSPVDITNDPVGRWELARLTGVTATTMTLDAPLVNSYAANITQVILVREYSNVTVNAPGNITAPAWNGSTGGVVAFLASGSLAINAFPAINVTGKGFRGGQPANDTSGSTGCTGLDEDAQTGAQKGEGIAFTRYSPTPATGRGRVANGAGGGVCLNSGGGGGGNGGAGGQGGNSDLSTDGNRAVGGQGGAALTYGPINHLLMGGGGGAGHSANFTGAAGGAGGGIAFIRANATTGAGQMTANGAPGSNATGQDASGGGGGGGTIYLRITGAAACGSLQVLGGNGGSSNSGLDVGPGGSGGGGRILFQKGSGVCAPTAVSVNPGNPGVQADSSAPGGANYGAQQGTAGATTTLTGGFPATMPVPVVVTPANGSVTGTMPVLSGTLATTAPAGTQVAIYVDGSQVGVVTADASGGWTLTPTAALSEGSHTVYAVAINTAQAVQSVKSNTNTFTVDSTPPGPPTVATPADGATINDRTPDYTGTAEPGSTVTVYVDGNPTPVGTAIADSTTGAWTVTQPTNLPDGQHSVKATAKDAAGNTSGDSNTNNFTVDATPPAPPTVATPADGTFTNNNTPTYTGMAEPGSTVTVYVDDNPVGTVTADPTTGAWTFTQPTALPDGSHAVKATAADALGNVSGDSNINTFLVDTVAPPKPSVFTPADGSTITDNTPTYTGSAPGAVSVTVYVDGVQVGVVGVTGGSWSFTQPTELPDGVHNVYVISVDGAGNTSAASDTNTFTVDTMAPAAPVVLTPPNNSSTKDNTPDYTGTAEPGSTVTVYVDGTSVGTTTADVTTGAWSFTQPTALPDGQHEVKATATDAVGHVSPESNINTFTVDTMPPAAPVVSTPANGAIIGDNTPTYTGTAEPNSTVTVIVDGNVVGTTTANASGDWTFTPTTPLSNGEHEVKATATDAAGNISPESDTNTFTVNATVPATPVVTGPADNTVTNDNTPTYTGTAEPGSTVTVIINGNPVGTTTADAAGNWTLTQPTPLPDGPYVLTVTATNNAGNVSPASSPVDFTVDTAVPDTDIVSGPSGDTDSPDATFDFSSPESGVTYECSLDGGPYTACSDPTTFEDLADGEHTLSVRAKDAAGNVDPTPDTATWNVQTGGAEGPNLNFRGGGCASTSGDPSALALMGLAVLSALLARKRQA